MALEVEQLVDELLAFHLEPAALDHHGDQFISEGVDALLELLD